MFWCFATTNQPDTPLLFNPSNTRFGYNSSEADGNNWIPLAFAEVLDDRLDLDVEVGITQREKIRRAGAGLGRIQICQLSYLEKNMPHLIETVESDYSDDPEVIKAVEKLMADLK